MKEIKGYEGLYSITSCGRVYSHIRHKFLKTRIDKNGYIKVNLSNGGKKKTFYVHQLVAEAYLPNPNNYVNVKFLDGNRSNSIVSNLKWSSTKIGIFKR